MTASGQPFAWALTFTATLTSSTTDCSHVLPNGGLGTTAAAGPTVSITIPTDAQGKATAFYTAPTNVVATSDCQGYVLAVPAVSPSGIGGLNDPQLGTSWLANLTPSPASSIAIISGDGQAASPGATLGQPLVVEVKDSFGNGIGGVPVTWSTTSGSITPMSLTTDGGGRLSAKWTVGAGSGQQAATASIPGGASIAFTATVS